MLRSLPLLPLLLTPMLLLRGALVSGHFPGQPFGEGWGRLFASGQLGRWLRGLAPIGHGDLLAWPETVPFWPVDPLTSTLAAAVSIAAGGGAPRDAAALSLVVLLSSVMAGGCVWVLARMAGARPWAATCAGLAVQLHPFLLRSAQDGVVEVLAVGPLALLAAAAVWAMKAAGWQRWLLVLLATLATALTSPYYAVYAALSWCALLPWALFENRTRAWLPLGGAVLLGGMLAAAPLLHAEWGPNGRLDSRYEGGGYQIAPTGQVVLDLNGTTSRGTLPRTGMPPTRRGVPKSTHRGRAGPPSTLSRLLHGFPGGLTCLVALMAGLAVRSARPWAALAFGMFVLGAGPPLLARCLTPSPIWLSPIQELLQLLPVTDSMGNAQRLVMLYVLPAAIAGALAASRWVALVPVLLLSVVGEAWLTLPDLRVATTSVDVDETILAAIDGPVVTFPIGDPPVWNAASPPKRALYLATLHGQPVAGDFGRGRNPADLGLVATLSAWSGLTLDPAVARQAAYDGLPASDPPGFTSLLVLHESLDERQRTNLHRHARARWGLPLAKNEWGAVYRIGD